MGYLERLRAPRPAAGGIHNLSATRRGVLAAGAGALLLGLSLPRAGRAQQGPPQSRHATDVAAYLRIAPDGGIHLLSPFVEGGQGIATSSAQIIAEELDADPARFTVDCAPAGDAYVIMFGDQVRFTGGSYSTRSSYATFRKLGATARAMLVQAAAQQWKVPAAECATEPGRVVHAASGRHLDYGALAGAAAALPVPTEAPLKDPARFRLIGKPVPRLDARAKSTGAARYGIDATLPGMLQAAVAHAPRLGAEPAAIGNEAAVRAMPGVHSIHRLPGAVAVVADRWWRARRAVEALEITWAGGKVPADFSSSGQLAAFKAAAAQPGVAAEKHGDAAAALSGAAKVVEAEYDAPYLAHAQLEPSSALAAFAADGTLDLIVPNQAPEMYQAVAAKLAGLKPEQVRIQSPMLGGFFGRHFLYDTADVFPQAIALAKATGRPVKVLWTREEEFRRDAYRPLSYGRLRAGLDAQGRPVALHAVVAGEGPMGRHMPGFLQDPKIDDSAVEGLTEKPYAIPARQVDYVKSTHAGNIGFWRSVGHSMNAFIYESFLDEVAGAAGQDPFAFRLALLRDSRRHSTLLNAVADLSGGWKRGPYQAADGTRRARGVAMASPFGSETATIAEVSIKDGEVQVHHIWVAIDPGSIVNPAIVEAQVRSAVAIGLSSALLEEVAFEKGEPQALNFDAYPILPHARMPPVSVRIIESGAPMGGVGEPGTPGVPPAVTNAVAALTGQRIRTLPLARARFGTT
ncbi:xanthine dehydrogenase family protein molybdopterin-binding subunit [Paracraurococcus ruber]|uniref:Isoquinoline 1-oxidoreductase n=1 Tax=Paracraurococcus ruber TaxID=77675 RepID=A0ABS1D625_9PROT|nr:xanthine dehydrogenase family protein molybdopterin-binding subunit [Paracraurococcus ruber]MBK1661790.1 isoquinoline 1-oxidoreductase [Paracraurococcus ruber]TDG17574.1 xanthine dehydrogenase family protein molybdopterin-binding subunit [Paracraurococcus ruber]